MKRKKTNNNTFLISLLILSIGFLPACSNVQNREKPKVVKKTKSNIELTITSKSTTTGETKSETFDKDIENMIITKIESLLSEGSNKSIKFIGESTDYVSTFKNYENYKVNKVEVELNLLIADTKSAPVIASKINQKLIDKTEKTSENSGIIYFNEKGNVIGFDFGPTKDK